MIAARDYYPPISKPSRLKKSRRGLPDYSPTNPQKIANLSTKRDKIRHYLQFLLFVQKSSATLTFCLVILTLGVYGWTVRAPTLWSQEFRKLTKLQQDERYLVGANEVLKHQLAQQAQQPELGFTQLHPEDLIFLPDVEVVPLSVTNTTISNQGNPWVAESPVAY